MGQKKEKHVLIVENSGAGNNLRINESSAKSTKLQLEGKFTEFDIENRNKRMYTADKFIPYMNLLLEKKKSLGVLYGEYDHPDVFDVTCKNLSHVINDLKYNEAGNCVDGNITLLNNSWGKEARSIIEDEYPLFVSSRAAGVTNENGMVQLKELFTYDIVADPGFASARVTPTLMNESLGFKVNDDVPYRIYEMNDAQANALFVDNKNDNKTKQDIMQFEAFLQTELIKFEAQLLEKITGKKYLPEEATDLMEKIELVKEELAGVNKVLEFFRTKMITLINDNSKLRDDNKRIQTEVSENLLHANHLTGKLKNLTKYAIQIDERLNSSEGLLEHVATHTNANILFSKDIANNLSNTAKEVEATQGLLEHVATNVKENAEALLFVINESTDIKGFVENIATEVEATQGLLEHVASEGYNDQVWLTYIHEKVDGVINYTNDLVTSLKNDNKKLLKENINNTTELNGLDNIESYLGLDAEQNLANKLENETKIANVDTKIAVNEDEENDETNVGTSVITTEEPELGVGIVTPALNQIEEPVQTIVTEEPIVTSVETDTQNLDTLEAKFLNQLVKILATDDTGIVIEITPDNKLVIQKSGTEETSQHDETEIETLDTDDNIVETITNLVGEINKHKALAVKEPHFFTMLSDKQIVEFKELDLDTQANIINMMNEKEYYSATEVLNHIASYIGEKTMNKEERLTSCLPESLKESWNNLDAEAKKNILAESVYFPIKTETDMINFWTTRSFSKANDAKLIKEAKDLEEQTKLNAINELDAFTDAFKGL